MEGDDMKRIWISILVFLTPFLVKSLAFAENTTDMMRNDAEKYVSEQVENGEKADLKEKYPEEANREISAEFLKRLLERSKIPENGVIIKNARIKKSFGLRNTKISFRVSLESCIFDEKIKFEGVTFDEDLNFNGTTFSGGVSFKNAIFAKDSIFSQSKFSKKADFSKAEFFGEAFLEYAKFFNAADFSEAKFKETARFSGAKFSGKAKFEFAAFSGGADFSDTVFSKAAKFSDTEFSTSYEKAKPELPALPEAANFLNAAFSGKADFSEAKFSGKAFFDHAAFSGEAYFAAAKFTEAARFSGAKFYKKTKFESAAFSGAADFTDAIFSKKADFTKSQFSGEAYFAEAKFNEAAIFSGAKFYEKAKFESAAFSGAADFTDAIFSKTADFKASQFSGETDFKLCSFKGKTICTACLFDTENKINFDNVSGFSIMEMEWEYDPERFEKVKDEKNIERRGLKHHLNYNETFYIALIKNYSDMGWLREADDAYYTYRVEKRKFRRRNLNKIPNTMSRLFENVKLVFDYLMLDFTFGYGVKPNKLLRTLILFWIPFAFYYVGFLRTSSGENLPWWRAWNPFYKPNRLAWSLIYSLDTLTPGINFESFETINQKVFIKKNAKRVLYIRRFQEALGWYLVALFLIMFGKVWIR